MQIKTVEIISAPKQNVDSEAAPRMLKVALSDGKTICHGIEFEHISKLRYNYYNLEQFSAKLGSFYKFPLLFE